MSDNVLTDIEMSQKKIEDIQTRLKIVLNEINIKYEKELKEYEDNTSHD